MSPVMTQMGIRLTEDQSRDLDQIAAELHNTKAGLIRLAIDQLLTRQKAAKEDRQKQPELLPTA